MFPVPSRRFAGVEPRRLVAFLALLAVLVVVFTGAAHAAATDHGDHGCSICIAYFATAVAVVFAPALLLVLAVAHRTSALRASLVPIASRRAFLAAPRAPPVDA